MIDKNRFLPGIIWCDCFIPGYIAKLGFSTGIATDKGFMPGIIANGVFVPGIAHGSNFVPGIMSNDTFISGCYTTDGKFVAGRFLQGRFESGVVDGNTLVPTQFERISPKDAHTLLQKEGYGFKALRRFDPVGGIPIYGVITGVIGDTPVAVHTGLLTDIGGVLSGLLSYDEPVRLVDRTAIEQLLGIDGTSLKELKDGLGNRPY